MLELSRIKIVSLEYGKEFRSFIYWWNFHWCQHGLVVAPQIVIDATKSHLQCLGHLTQWVCSLKHLVPNWKGPYTHKVQSWSHHLVEDVEDLADGAEDPEDYAEDIMDDGDSLDGL